MIRLSLVFAGRERDHHYPKAIDLTEPRFCTGFVEKSLHHPRKTADMDLAPTGNMSRTWGPVTNHTDLRISRPGAVKTPTTKVLP